MKSKLIGVTLALSIILFLAACGAEDDARDGNVSYSEAVDYTITGIEPGAGIMGLTEDVLEEYGNLEGWTLEESSTAGMLTELSSAIQNEEPIVITGWNPHFMFADYDIKYLDDPKGTFGEVEDIITIVREGLEADMPNAYEILDRFHWEPADMEKVMLEADDTSFEAAAEKWVEENQDKVNEWTEGVDEVDGKEIELVQTQWESALSSGEVMKRVLEQQGYQVTITPADPAIVAQAMANGEGDASIALWLPITHGAFYEEHKDDFIDLGVNLSGARVGLAVPEYMDIDSIEDLEPNE